MRRDVETNERKIITSLRLNGAQTTSELVESTELSRDTIHEYCKRFSRNNLVRKNGKFGKYYLTGDGETYGHPSLKGQNFAREAMKIFALMRIAPTNYNDRKEQLKQFGNKIGALCLYSIIQSMAPRIWNPNIDGITIEENIGKERDLSARQWLRNCINPLQMLIEFSKLDIVRRGLFAGTAIPPPPLRHYLEYHFYKPPNLTKEQNNKWQKKARQSWDNLNRIYEKNKKRDFDPDDPYQPNFELNSKTYKNLLHLFEESFPDVYKDLEKIWSGLDDEVRCDLSFANIPKHVKGRLK